jgi:membrane protease YdiL (CAAX protease family)
LDTKRIYIFLALAFGIAWATALVIYLTGGLANSPILVEGTPISLALLLLAGPVMWAPALAHLLTRWITGEGWHNLYLRPRLKQGWPYWLAAWFLPGLLAILGMVIYFALFPGHFDPTLGVLQEMISAAGAELPDINLWLIVAVQVVQALLLAPLINSVATFGEEFGWRAYLQPKLLPLGPRKALLWLGLIWGVWHWPIILMGHNYGLEYPGAPFLGPLMMVWFTLVLGIFLGWVTMRGGSVWPAVIGHAAINGIGGLGFLFVRGEPNPLLGPAVAGLIGSLGFTLLAGWIFSRLPDQAEAEMVQDPESEKPGFSKKPGF